MISIILQLNPKAGHKIDFSRFVVQYTNNPSCVDLSDYDVVHVAGSPIDHFREEFLDYLKKYGLHSYLRRRRFLEAIVPPGESQDQIIDLLTLYLDSLQIDHELIIIDPYIFPTNAPMGYQDFFVDLIGPYLSNVKTLPIITSNTYNSSLATSIVNRLRSRSGTLQVPIRRSANWHDRYWITNNRSKGIFIGTSLNGLGRKYSCVDILDDSDVTDIVSGLVSEGLIH